VGNIVVGNGVTGALEGLSVVGAAVVVGVAVDVGNGVDGAEVGTMVD